MLPSDLASCAQGVISSLRNVSIKGILSTASRLAAIVLPMSARMTSPHEPPLSSLKRSSALPLPFPPRGFLQPWYTSPEQQTRYESTNREFIEIFESQAWTLRGADANVTALLQSTDGYAFAHEAPVYFADKDELYFCSDAGGPNGRSDRDNNNVVFRIQLGQIIARAAEGLTSLEADVEKVALNSDSVQMTNGGTSFQSRLLLINSGRTQDYPPSLTLTDRNNISDTKALLNNAFGRHFNALNDVKVNPIRGSIYFTDASYGQSQGFRPETELPKAVWRFDTETARLTMLDASVTTPNGLAFSNDGLRLYVTDTGAFPGGGQANVPAHVPSVIYEFDVVYGRKTERLQNRRIFAYVPTGVADGINVDMHGNVYSCLADGLYIWDKDGILLMRVFLGKTCYNFTFAGKGRVVVLADTHLYLVQLSLTLEGQPLDKYPLTQKRWAQAIDL